MISRREMYAIIILGSLVIISGLFLLLRKDDPTSWIDDGVNVSKATSGYSYQDYISQQYHSPEIHTGFSHEVWGEGMSFTENLDPQNDVPEIYIFARPEENEVHIFVDEDWRKQYRNTNILWGRDFQNYRDFRFNEIESGIYHDAVQDDPDRFNEDYSIHYGGVIVGEVPRKMRDPERYPFVKFK